MLEGEGSFENASQARAALKMADDSLDGADYELTAILMTLGEEDA